MTQSSPAKLPRVIVFHDSGGAKYFEALIDLRRRQQLASLEFYETSVLYNCLRSIIVERKGLPKSIKRALQNLWVRLTLWRIHDSVIIVGVAPWNFRFPFYALLRSSNRFFYHTSWPYWDDARIPKKLGPLTSFIKAYWLRILSDQRSEAVAVTSPAAQELKRVASGSISPVTIPHVVSAPFFAKRAVYCRPFHLVFVGQLVPHKGISHLEALMSNLQGEDVVLDIVGDGPLAPMVREMVVKYPCKWHGFVSDREVLATIMAQAQCLVSPAIKTAGWEELFGISIIEAMACGLPCLVTDHVGPRSFVISGANSVLLAEGAVAEMADWIRKLIRNPDLWAALSTAASATAEQYKLAVISQQWDKLLRQ